MLRDKRVWLGVAAVVVLVVAWRVLMPAAAPAPAAAVSPRTRAARALTDAQPAVLRPVRLDALTASREQPDGAKRNPFRFQQPPAPPPPEKPVFTPPVSTGPTGPPPPVVPEGPRPPPPIPLKFIGVVERANGVKWAVLSDGKTAPQHGKEGDVIDGRYRIVKIGTESVELTYVDGRGRQTVRLTGQ